jgi:transcriptional regulator with XRE-family HTH domain
MQAWCTHNRYKIPSNKEIVVWQTKIQVELKARKMTQEDLAIDTDLSQSAISAFLAGKKTPSLDSLEKIVLALDMTLAELFDYTKQDQFINPEEQENELKRLQSEIQKLIENTDLSHIHSLSLLLSITRKILR